MPQMRTLFHFFPADPSVDHSKYMLLEPSLCREVRVTEGVWSNNCVGVSLLWRPKIPMVEQSLWINFPQILRTLRKNTQKMGWDVFSPWSCVVGHRQIPSPHLEDVTKSLAALTWTLSSFGRCPFCPSFYEELMLSRSYRVIVKNTDTGARVRSVA